MADFIARIAVGKVADRLKHDNPSITETDPEIRAAAEAAIASTKRHWWRKRPQADIILSASDRQVLRAVKKRAWYLDRGFKCCCFSVGLDGIIGLIPVLGDFMGVLLALHLVRTACKVDLPNHIIYKMLTNVVVDFIVGLVPFAGDILDVMFKCNWRNAMILEEYLFLKRRDELRSEGGGPGHYGSTASTARSVDTKSTATQSNSKVSVSSSKDGERQQVAPHSSMQPSSSVKHHTAAPETRVCAQNVNGSRKPREYASFISFVPAQ